MDRILAARSFGELFSLVRECVYEAFGRRRAGIMLGMSPLGISPGGFIGAYHQVGTNLIVMNEDLLEKIKRENPGVLNYYIFHLLMHEYIHSFGVVDEWHTRLLTYEASRKAFGGGHMITKIARNFSEFLPDLKYPDMSYGLPDSSRISLIEDFEEEDTSYIG